MPGFDSLVLRTERLSLRPLRPADAPALFAIFADPRVMRHGSTPPWASQAVAEQTIAQDQQALAAGEHLRLGLERRDDGALIGTCSLFALHPASRRAEIGYALAAPAWRQGYAHEALCALLDHGFGPLALNRVEADIHPGNEASARVLERLGFTREGLLRERWIVAGEVSDSALYGLLQREWLARPRLHAPMRRIETPRLVLEPLLPAHAEPMFALLSDPAIYEFENAPPASLAALRERYGRLASRRSPDGREAWLNWVIRLPDGRVAGYVQATLTPDGRAGIAYELGSAFWGRGLASEAVRAMIAELAARHGVRRLWAELKQRNLRSLRLLQRLGFEPAPAGEPVDDDECRLVRAIAPEPSP